MMDRELYAVLGFGDVDNGTYGPVHERLMSDFVIQKHYVLDMLHYSDHDNAFHANGDDPGWDLLIWHEFILAWVGKIFDTGTLSVSVARQWGRLLESTRPRFECARVAQ